MGLSIGDYAPDFEADTTKGRISFHEWIGDWWAVLFSHPKDFTPVCTTELGQMAKLAPEFERRGVKVIGLSVDATESHIRWADDIEETQGARPGYPIIGDTDLSVSKLYGMLPASAEGDASERCALDNLTVRSVFVISPDKKIRLIVSYPNVTGRNFDELLRVIDSLQLATRHPVVTPANWKPGEDVMILNSVSDDQARALFGEWKSVKPYIRVVPQPRGPVSRSAIGALTGPVPAGQGPVGPSPLDDGLPPGGRRRVLGIFAHPDDETFCAGGTFASYAQQGAEIMVVSATRGEAGQIRDVTVGNRRTIAAVREAELRLACQRLGATKVRCLNYVDGTLADADFPALVAEATDVICDFRPDVVITFGPDGGYGHPDHVAISAVTTAACQQAAARALDRQGTTASVPPAPPPRLYHRCFPPGDLLIMDRLATWLTSRPNRFAGTPAFAHALLLLAEAAGTMRHIRDHVQVRWYPPDSCVVEQGEAATELFLILSGEAAVWQESGSHREQLARLGVGEFFGELGIATHGQRSADVVAATSLTCLVLSPAPPTKFAGRGQGARLAGALPGERPDGFPAAGDERAGQGIVCCDVSGQVVRKVQALSAYRSQFSLEPGMFPQFLLQEMFGCEYFIAVPAGQARLPDEVPQRQRLTRN